MAKDQNFFAKREALKLLNTLLRNDKLKEVLMNFVSNVVFLKCVQILREI